MTTSPSSLDSLSGRLAHVRSRLAEAARAAGRAPEDVALLAVSKGHPPETIREAYALGLRDFGENYVQEWMSKRDALADLSDLRWHFIGNLQSNKAKFLVDSVTWVQSVDRASVAEVLERLRLRAEERKGRLPVLVEMEVDPADENKGGIPQASAGTLCALLQSCQELEWKGFMGMGPAHVDDEQLAELYARFVARCRELWALHGRAGEPVISLGMSDDLEMAIAAGSTMVRVGTSLFGERD